MDKLVDIDQHEAMHREMRRRELNRKADEVVNRILKEQDQ